MTVDAFSQHPTHPFFDVVDDCLTISGRSLQEVAAQVGRTPFYVYARQHLTERVEELRSILPREIDLHYAMKANPMPAVVSYLGRLVDGLDVASGLELRTALDCGVDPSRISFAGPGKSVAELRSAVAAGIILNVESELEIARLLDIGRELARTPRIAIRVNPDFELKSSGMKMSGGPKQFGIDAERVPDVLASLRDKPLDFVGFHIFSGSLNLKAEAIIEAQQKAVALAADLARSAPAPVTLLNIGGGFGIPHFPGEQRLDVDAIGRHMHELVKTTAQQLPNARLAIELGRYLVGEAGLYVCRVLDKKVSRGRTFLVTDGGLHHHLSASGNFGQVIRKNYPVLIGNRVRGTRREVVNVVGPLCTPLDVLADRMELAEAEVGDLVVVFQSGAYGLSASPLGFLSHPTPAEILL